MIRPTSEQTLQDTLSLIEKVILKADGPLDIDRIVSALPVLYRVDAATALNLLDRMVKSGKAFPWKPKSRLKAPRFWKSGDVQHCKQHVLALVSVKPMTEAELLKKLRSALFGLPVASIKTIVKHALNELVAERRLFRHPPLRARQLFRYGAKPVDSAPYLKKLRAEFDRLVKLFQHSGLGASDILESLGRSVDPSLVENLRKTDMESSPAPIMCEDHPPEKTLADMCDHVLHVIDTRIHGARNSLPIWLPELRGYTGLSKYEFDRAIIHLARSGKLHLDRHNYPGSLDEKSREVFVQDETGVSYVAAVLK